MGSPESGVRSREETPELTPVRRVPVVPGAVVAVVPELTVEALTDRRILGTEARPTLRVWAGTVDAVERVDGVVSVEAGVESRLLLARPTALPA